MKTSPRVNPFPEDLSKILRFSFIPHETLLFFVKQLYRKLGPKMSTSKLEDSFRQTRSLKSLQNLKESLERNLTIKKSVSSLDLHEKNKLLLVFIDVSCFAILSFSTLSSRNLTPLTRQSVQKQASLRNATHAGDPI